MTPDRQEVVNGHKVEEYWWGGEFVVYIDNLASELTYEEAIEILSEA